MALVRAIWRFIAKAWLVAAPLVMVFLLFVGAPIVLAVAHAIIARTSGPEVADTLLMDVMTWTWIAVLVLAPTGLIGLWGSSLGETVFAQKSVKTPSTCPLLT
jgi:hypothetical protein